MFILRLKSVKIELKTKTCSLGPTRDYFEVCGSFWVQFGVDLFGTETTSAYEMIVSFPQPANYPFVKKENKEII